MRKNGKYKNIEQANLMLEQSYLKSKGLLIPLELGIWGKAAVILLLITALANGIYEKYFS